MEHTRNALNFFEDFKRKSICWIKPDAHILANASAAVLNLPRSTRIFHQQRIATSKAIPTILHRRTSCCRKQAQFYRRRWSFPQKHWPAWDIQRALQSMQPTCRPEKWKRSAAKQPTTETRQSLKNFTLCSNCREMLASFLNLKC